MALNREQREERRKKMVGRLSWVESECRKRGILIEELLKDGVKVRYRCDHLFYYPWTGSYFNTNRTISGKGAKGFFRLLEEDIRDRKY